MSKIIRPTGSSTPRNELKALNGLHMADNFENEDSKIESSELQDEAEYVCNSCGEEIVVPLDYSQGSHQEYVEDCPVCCHPNIIFVEFGDDGEVQVWSRSEQDS